MDKSSALVDAARGASTQAPSDDTTRLPAAASSEIPMPSSHATANSCHTPKQSSAVNSLHRSPAPSRDTSPARNPRKRSSTQTLATASRSRKNSQLELSPSRQLKTVYAETSATSRPLSSTATPSLRPVPKHSQNQGSVPQKATAVQDLKDSHRWPVSPRLRSPPPQLSKPNITPVRRAENDPPLISIQRPGSLPLPPEALQPSVDNDSDDSHMQAGHRTLLRGPLETVQEVSQNNSPAHAANASLLEHVKEKFVGTDGQSDGALSDSGRTPKSKHITMPGPLNVAEPGGPRAESRRPSSAPPPPALVSRQSSALSTRQFKPKSEGSTQNMTVETETVPSVPQVALASGTKSEGANGSLKAKPSAETIRPKKDKKKSVRKQPQVNTGTGASKADNFEAKIASAVDEANTSDSEETFVYDSNPPDNTERSNRRFHSRTPSATSMASQADRANLRSIYGVMEGVGHGHGPAPKKSMKFVNTFGGGNASDSLTPGDEDGKGTGRSTGGSTRGTLRHHHHIGRWGWQPGNGHASLFDTESPFPNAAKSKLGGSNSRNPSGPTSPRAFHSARSHLSSKRSAMQMSSSYDLDDTTGADDERTPLVETGRSLRTNRSMRGPHNLRQAESQTYTKRFSYLNRFAACLVLTMMLLLVITAAIGFMFATSQLITGIELVSIGNVVTSEQMLMFDVTIKAHNPNIVVVIMDHANLEIFAKSEFADPDLFLWGHRAGPFRLHAGDDPHNNVPPRPETMGDDDENDTRPNTLLGRVTVFDSPLTFEGFLFHQGSSSSTGELQLSNPGNNSVGGSERWLRIYQSEFDLIVKGVVKYSLPLSAHVRSATVSGRTTVKPNSTNNPSLKPNTVAIAL